jgi:peptide/nickel transport system permease protein
MIMATQSNSTAVPARRPLGVFGQIARKFLRHPLGVAGATYLCFIVILAVLAPWVAPYDPDKLFYEAVLSPPSPSFLFGTDEIGRDILSRLIYGARVSLQVVAGAIALSLLVGATIGLISGYVGGAVDGVIMRIMDALLTFPLLILALAIVAILGPSLVNAMIAIAVVNIPEFARIVRGQALLVREQDFILATKALGGSSLRIMAFHIWPNVAGNMIIYASLRASSALIVESSLAFLGLGTPPPTATWGQMLATSLQFSGYWWMSIFPGLAIFLGALSFNFVGDGLRDALDSRSDR